MQMSEGISDRQFRVLAAVIQIYVETAEPAGSQAVTHRSRLGISPASIRTTMGELEAKGLLFHAHTSGGRIPTDRGYRLYVNQLLPGGPVPERARARLESEIAPASRSAIDEILRRAAQILGVLTQELGVAIAPALDELVLERLELVRVSSERAPAAGARAAEPTGPDDLRRDPRGGGTRGGGQCLADPQRATRRAAPAGDPDHLPGAAPRRRRPRRGARPAQHLRGAGRGALRSLRRREHRGAGERAAPRGAARVRVQRADAAPARPD